MKPAISSQSRTGWIGSPSGALLAPGAARFAASPSASFRRQD